MSSHGTKSRKFAHNLTISNIRVISLLKCCQHFWSGGSNVPCVWKSVVCSVSACWPTLSRLGSGVQDRGEEIVHKLVDIWSRAGHPHTPNVRRDGGGFGAGVGEGGASVVSQVWSLTQFYSVDFSQSRIGVKKCVFYKRTIKVCASCFWRCPETFVPSTA